MNCVHRPSSYLPSAPFLTPTGTLGCHRGRSSVGRSFTLEVLILLSFLDLRRSLLLLDPSLKRGSWRSTPESDRLVYWSRDTGSRLSGDTVWRDLKTGCLDIRCPPKQNSVIQTPSPNTSVPFAYVTSSLYLYNSNYVYLIFRCTW